MDSARTVEDYFKNKQNAEAKVFECRKAEFIRSSDLAIEAISRADTDLNMRFKIAREVTLKRDVALEKLRSEHKQTVRTLNRDKQYALSDLKSEKANWKSIAGATFENSLGRSAFSGVRGSALSPSPAGKPLAQFSTVSDTSIPKYRKVSSKVSGAALSTLSYLFD
nr:hypothetical protein [Tomato fruit blotch virus]